MEHRFAGPRSITILGLNTGTLDVSKNGWGHQVGLNGERNKIFTEEGSQKFDWSDIKEQKSALTWYKVMFFISSSNEQKMR